MTNAICLQPLAHCCGIVLSSGTYRRIGTRISAGLRVTVPFGNDGVGRLVRGRVLDSRHEPLTGATVELVGAVSCNAVQASSETTSDCAAPPCALIN